MRHQAGPQVGRPRAATSSSAPTAPSTAAPWRPCTPPASRPSTSRSSRCRRASATSPGATSTPWPRRSTRRWRRCCSSRSRARVASTRRAGSTSRRCAGSATSAASCSSSTRSRPVSGRTGEWFGFQHYGVRPDVVTVAKALGNGVPIGACWARDDVAAAFVPGDHATTFGGQPLATAAARAVLAVMEAEDVPARARTAGAYLDGRPARSLPGVRGGAGPGAAGGGRAGPRAKTPAGRGRRPRRPVWSSTPSRPTALAAGPVTAGERGRDRRGRRHPRPGHCGRRAARPGPAVKLSKRQRQHRIIQIIEQHAVTSQAQLVELLAAAGVEATQATVSRDLDEIGAVKVRVAGGESVYAVPDLPKDRVAPEDHLRRVLGEWVVEVASSANLVVVRTPPGSAHVVASALDRAGAGRHRRDRRRRRHHHGGGGRTGRRRQAGPAPGRPGRPADLSPTRLRIEDEDRREALTRGEASGTGLQRRTGHVGGGALDDRGARRGGHRPGRRRRPGRRLGRHQGTGPWRRERSRPSWSTSGRSSPTTSWPRPSRPTPSTRASTR